MGTLEVKKRKASMTKEILQLIEQCSRINKRKTPEYNRLHKLIRREIRNAKEKCDKIESMQERHAL